ncbi:MAG: DUF433 domain-containing protein [Acidobacteriota bacterium]|nr:DUF433 domain-containing protein [Acidobacteriota bacterium]
MTELLKVESIPLAIGTDGVMRVRSTRVTLDSLVTAFFEGATAEEIAQQYPTVSLADIYQVIGYYLRYETELQGYLSGRRQSVDEAKRANESRCPADGIRERLLVRRQQ